MESFGLLSAGLGLADGPAMLAMETVAGLPSAGGLGPYVPAAKSTSCPRIGDLPSFSLLSCY